jgi:hypothetical protein
MTESPPRPSRLRLRLLAALVAIISGVGAAVVAIDLVRGVLA